jgi:3'(2'), 5'-bisphosphate nucleotidase
MFFDNERCLPLNMSDNLFLAAELEVAARAASDAGAAILPFYGNVVARMKPGDSPVTDADVAANEIVLGAIRRAFPEDAILSEESADSPERLGAERVWIVDPLDGTREFLNRTDDFAVMIGLAIGGRAVLGAIYRPVSGVLYTAVEGQGAWAESPGRSGGLGGRRERLRCVPLDAGAIRLVGSRSHPEPLVSRIAVELGVIDVTPIGSVAVKCASIAEGKRDLYLHPVAFLGEWDTCAPEVLVREAGGFVSDCRGAPLRYNKAVPNQPDGILATGEISDLTVVERIAEMYRAEKGPGERV